MKYKKEINKFFYYKKRKRNVIVVHERQTDMTMPGDGEKYVIGGVISASIVVYLMNSEAKAANLESF